METPDELDVAPFIREFSSRVRESGSEPTKTETGPSSDLDVPSFIRQTSTTQPARTTDGFGALQWGTMRRGSSSSDLDTIRVPANVSTVTPNYSDDLLSVWSGKFPLEPIGLMLAGAICAKSERGSEDSCPLVVIRSRGDGNVTLTGAVCDGVGGAGSSTTLVDEGGRMVERTQAFVASRLVRRSLTELSLSGQALDAQTLQRKISKSLAEFKDRHLHESSSSLRGSMIKTLPSTLALFQCLIDRANRGGSLRLTTSWAGDSRIYVLSPRTGLAQLTRDDVEIDDAFEQLKLDPPTTNVLNGSGSFEVHRTSIHIDLPCVVVAATDGMFGYLPTPGSLELLLLQEMAAATDITQFAHSIALRVGELTADDVSFVIAMIGFGADIQSAAGQFATRLRSLNEQYGGRTPEELLLSEESELERLWLLERKSYSRLLAGDR